MPSWDHKPYKYPEKKPEDMTLLSFMVDTAAFKLLLHEQQQVISKDNQFWGTKDQEK